MPPTSSKHGEDGTARIHVEQSQDDPELKLAMVRNPTGRDTMREAQGSHRHQAVAAPRREKLMIPHASAPSESTAFDA